MSDILNLVILGHTPGKMGQAISEIASNSSNIRIIDRASAKNSSNVVMIDFTHPDALNSHLQEAKSARCALVIGTTGLQDEHQKAIREAAKHIPILAAPNTSLGANLLGQIAKMLAGALPEADVEITEIHHKHKIDSPSGTAFFLATQVAAGRNQNLAEHLVLDRHSHGPRKKHDIGVVGLRGGNAKGEHTVYFLGENETIELKHHVSDRKVFAEGALKAASFLVKQPPGVYTMADALKIY